MFGGTCQCDSGFFGTDCSQAGPTDTPTDTPTETPTETPMGPGQPLGGACSDPDDCMSGNCVDDVCCADASCAAGQSCDNPGPGNLGISSPHPVAPAPAISRNGVLLALGILIAIGGGGFLRRRGAGS